MTMMSATIPYDGAVVVTTPATATATATVHSTDATGEGKDGSVNLVVIDEANTITDVDAQVRTKARASCGPPLNPLWARMTGLRLSPGWRATYNPHKIGADKPLPCRLSECESFYWNRFDLSLLILPLHNPTLT